jgi:hypothetical protein
MSGRLRRSTTAVAAFTALLAALGAGCSSNRNGSAQNTPPCTTSAFCVHLGVTGAVSGNLSTTSPPANFRSECAITRPIFGIRSAWVTHQFGRLAGHTWLFQVEAPDYKTTGTYPVTVTLGDVGSGGSGATYSGQGTATLRSGGTAATVSARLGEVSGRHRSVSVVGTIGCPTLVKLH